MSKEYVLTIVYGTINFGLILFYLLRSKSYKETIDEKNNRIIDLNNLSIRQSDRISELEKKAKLSNNVLAVLNEVNNEGAILHVQRINKDDIFLHNGSQYR